LRSEALLMAADRAEHVEKVIGPELQAGRWVICDRFTASTIAYQGFGRGLDLDELKEVTRFASCGLAPDLQVLLDLSVSAARERTRRAADRMEKLGDDFFERVRQGYLGLAESDPKGWVVIDATAAPDVVATRIHEAVRSRLGAPQKVEAR
jgi:dTMP kinase